MALDEQGRKCPKSETGSEYEWSGFSDPNRGTSEGKSCGYIYRTDGEKGREGKGMEGSGSRKKMKVAKSEEKGGIGYLPCDVLCDVLSRLPVKSLCRFKCVSNGWLNLMKDKSFVQLHMIRSKLNGSGRYLRTCIRRSGDSFIAKASFYKLEEEEEDGRVAASPSPMRVGKVLSFRLPTLPPSCNGLVCYMNSAHHVKVCNPITRETITLPQPNFLDQKRVTDLEDLNFTVMLGIGYVPSEDVYKVVVAWSTRTDSDVEIFTLGDTNSWRPVSSKQYGTLLSDPFCRFAPPVYANGTLYWYLTENCFAEDEYGDPCYDQHFRRYAPDVISFNFAEEKFNLIPVPNDVDRLNHVCWICELQGHLCLLERPEYSTTMKMWMLNNNHQWVARKIPPSLLWVGTIRTNGDGYMSIVRQGKDQVTLHSGLYNFEGQLVKPTAEVDPFLPKYDFEVGQFHQESLVGLTSM